MTVPVADEAAADGSQVESITEDLVPVADWIPLEPPVLTHRQCRVILRRCARRLASVSTIALSDISAIRADTIKRAQPLRGHVAVQLVACIHVLCDLRTQGWQFRVSRNEIAARAPVAGTGQVNTEKARVRSAHLIERDSQLSQPSVRQFVRGLERPRLVGNEWKSILTLMRDGRELADNLRRISTLSDEEARIKALRTVVDPYVQVVHPDSVCQHTGLKLSHIWRYFRHTWTTTYQSTPGRKVFFLVRDRATKDHPIVGIGALGSAIVQLSVRDEWIGWTGSQFMERLRREPNAVWSRWLRTSLRSLIDAVLVDDLVREGVISRAELTLPSVETVARLRDFSTEERRLHRLYPDRAQHKRAQLADDTDKQVNWKHQASTHLFRSKRALSLAELLDARRKLREAGLLLGRVKKLRQVLDDPNVIAAIHTVLRYMKARHVGVNMMDITVCGAISPYNELLGGKLVSLMMTSPDVIAAYQDRYRTTASVIASSMAGRPIRRRPTLVVLGTTSLYGVGASQYNRIRVPAQIAGGATNEFVAFVPLGKTIGYGSYHFSRETMAAFDVVLRRLIRGRPVNSIFGEGVNPKLRKVRGALDAIGLPSELLLQHGSPRLVYAIPLASNFREVLIGTSRRPQYLIPQTNEATNHMANYWRVRWLNRRLNHPGVLEAIAAHSLAHPIRHGARVSLPEVFDEIGPLFASNLRPL